MYFYTWKKIKKQILSGMIVNHQYQKCGIITKMVIGIFNFKCSIVHICKTQVKEVCINVFETS